MNERISVGWIDPERLSGHFAHSIATAIRDLEYFGSSGRIFRHSASQPIVARNNLVREFLEEDDSEWLWMVDADEVFDKGHVMKLWEVASETGADMVSGLVMIWKDGNTAVPSIFFEDESGEMGQIHNYIPEGPREIAACGLGSVLVHRRVFEAMQAPRHPDYRWFDFLLNSDIGIVGSEMTGTDVQFFKRARNMGFSLWVCPDAEAVHIEEIGVGRREWEKQWQSVS